jgi:Uma2 family endonuclease
MASATVPPPTAWTAVDLANRFGPISLARIRSDPPPGQANEQDVLAIHQREKRLYELVDGILVEKTMGFREGFLAAELIRILGVYGAHVRGAVVGADGMMRLAPGLVRIPDVSFILWDKFPGGRIAPDPIPDLIPDLAVEVLSEGNTPQEMQRKLDDYFAVGVRQVWYIDPNARTVELFTAPDRRILLHEGQILDGGPLLPGFSLLLREFFAKLG